MNLIKAFGRSLHEKTDRWIASAIFIVSFTVYALTAEPTASYWDCPEYITTAAMLEIGHPPGNPTWSLAGRMIATLAPSPTLIPLFINLSSGLFTALAAMLLYLTILRIMAMNVSGRAIRVFSLQVRRAGAAVGALSFAFLDSTWFSAVEAEVYACSIFCTALCVWLALRWTDRKSPRIIILIAYITGLSIGVHQLNLLCIPALALIMLFGCNRTHVRFSRTLAVLLLSFAIIAAILFGMMPGMVAWASETELLGSSLLLPYNAGTIFYALGSILTVAAGAILSSRTKSPILLWLLLSFALSISGMLAFGGNLLFGILLSLFVSAAAFIRPAAIKRLAPVTIWCIAFLMTGFCTFSLIIIRAGANPPMNQGNPSNIFAFASYLGRDQYGSTPLLHGRTPQSRMLRKEIFRVNAEGDSVPDYSGVARKKRHPKYFRTVPDATIRNNSGLMTAADSAFNQLQYSSAGDRYVLGDYTYDYIYPPELDMWLPRITSSNPDHIEAYASWIGMTDSTMLAVEASEAIDSLGKPVGKLDTTTGKRSKTKAFRPTYLQNLEALASYQVAYMYFRYLLWNFVGRQNDIPSQGQVDAGNFITGFDAIDELMLGRQDTLPLPYGLGNPGRNPYYALPLLLVILGIVAQMRQGRAGERRFYIVLTLFFMTGLAIVLYLNQSPCEPRERDYSFTGSFYAFCIWLGTGASALSSWLIRLADRYCRKRGNLALRIVALIIPFGVPTLLLARNYDDHDRSGRTLTSDYAFNTLTSLGSNAVIFVAGDNFTFPLWYSQEVEGTRPDVRVINTAYLSTDWYPQQLLVPDRTGRSLPLFAKERNLAYGALISALIPADTTAVDAREAFLYMYNNSPATGFRFPSSRIRIPRRNRPDSLIIDLKNVSGGRSSLLRHQIVMLDIIASNAYSPSPSPIYWTAPLPDSQKISLARNGIYNGPAILISDTISDNVRHDYNHLAKMLLEEFRYGKQDGKPGWVDEPGKGQVRLLRKALRVTAAAMLDEGDPVKALRLLEIHRTRLPESLVPFKAYQDRYILRNEAVEEALLYARCAEALHRPELKEQALKILREEITESARWRNYYNLLPEGLRGVTSPHVLTAATNLYAPIDAYLRLGGDPEYIISHPLLKNIDLKKEAINWRIRVWRRQLLRDARYPEHPDSTRRHLDLYLKAGGNPDDLLKYKEITGAKDFPNIPIKK